MTLPFSCFEVFPRRDWLLGMLSSQWIRKPPEFRPEKRAQRLTFWVWRPPGGVGVFQSKGWWPKTSCLPSKVCLPWVSKRGIWDVPGILPGCPGPQGVFKKLVQKNFVRISFFPFFFFPFFSFFFWRAKRGDRSCKVFLWNILASLELSSEVKNNLKRFFFQKNLVLKGSFEHF